MEFHDAFLPIYVDCESPKSNFKYTYIHLCNQLSIPIPIFVRNEKCKMCNILRTYAAFYNLRSTKLFPKHTQYKMQF